MQSVAKLLEDDITPVAQGAPVVLIVEDDLNMRELVVNVLQKSSVDMKLIPMDSPQHALHFLENHEVGVVLTDLRMPAVDGLQVLEFAKGCNELTQVVLFTGYGTVETAVAALKKGAFDYIRKPFDNVELCSTVEHAVQHYVLSRDNRSLREQNQALSEGMDLIGQSDSMQQVQRLIGSAAAYDCSVFISGKSGSGKELVARQIHMQSKRREGPFVALNCAAIQENLIESELFGYRKGAFTGAEKAKPGLFEVANGGTIFLDEINNASLSLQAKLMRVLQDGSFYPVGDIKPCAVDVRVLAATNRNAAELIENGELREDLYYRLTVMEIRVPSLRERREDIPLLTYHFLDKYSKGFGKVVKSVSTEVLSALMQYSWPGNVRELENVIQRMMILTRTEQLDIDVLPAELVQNQQMMNRAIDYMEPQTLEEIEIYFIKKTLADTGSDRALCAQILGIDKSTLWRKIKRYNLEETDESVPA
ncbi:MAG: response regulator [Gammaproteobacteria bacterium]|nr:response regulator [Gammaproteobacteria bacterium]